MSKNNPPIKRGVPCKTLQTSVDLTPSMIIVDDLSPVLTTVYGRLCDRRAMSFVVSNSLDGTSHQRVVLSQIIRILSQLDINFHRYSLSTFI